MRARLTLTWSSGISRGFGFLRFIDVDAARSFLQQASPSFKVPASKTAGAANDDQTRVRVSYCKERKAEHAGGSEDSWNCPVVRGSLVDRTSSTHGAQCAFPNFSRRVECRRCQAARDGKSCQPDVQCSPLTCTDAVILPHTATPAVFRNGGDSDVSPDGTPSQFLLFRGLEPSVTEDLFAKGAAKLYKTLGSSPPPQGNQTRKNGAKIASTTGDSNLGAKDGTLKRVLLVKDRRSAESWRYGFAEFASIEVGTQHMMFHL